MATQRSDLLPDGKPWRARRRRSGTHFTLGYFATRREAEQAEREFDEKVPKAECGWSKGLKRDPITNRYYNPSTGLDY